MISFFKNKKVLFGLIILIGLLLRTINLSSNPPAMHADEADSGYTALSLLKTGMDPYGAAWPLHFKGQADIYRAPLYTYSIIPSVALFGLNSFSVRLPSVIFGVLLIVTVFYLLKHILKQENIALVGAFLIAINPWAIHLSRTGLEVLLSTLLTTLGILFFLHSKSKKYFLIFSSLFFTLSFFSYHPAKIFTPLIVVVLVLFNFPQMRKVKLVGIVSLAIFLLGGAILAYLAFFDKGASHLSDVNIFDKEKARIAVDAQRTQTTAPLEIASIFSNKPIYFFREYINMYIGPLSINYLFVNGESNLDKGMGNYGQYHLFELIPFIIGGVALWKRQKKLFTFVALWFLIGLIPAGITDTGNYAYRDVNSLVPVIIFTSLGFVEGYKYIQKNILKLWGFIYAGVSLILFAYFSYNYYFAYPFYSRDWWGYSQKDVINFVTQNKNQYPATTIHGGGDWPILYAFYNNLEPEIFQKSYSQRIDLNGNKIQKLDNIYFGNVVTDDERLDNNLLPPNSTLLITHYDFFKEIKSVKGFYAADGGTNYKALRVKRP